MTGRALFARNLATHGIVVTASCYTALMELRRAWWGAAIRLAIALSAVAGLVAVALDAAGVARSTIVLAVIVIGFVASWIRTERVARSHVRPGHGVVTVRRHELITG